MKNAKVIDFIEKKAQKELEKIQELKGFRDELDLVDPELENIFADIQSDVNYSILEFEKVIEAQNREFEIIELVMMTKNPKITFSKNKSI